MDWINRNLMRIWRLILAVVIALQAFTMHAYWLLIFSCLLLYQAYTNAGCGIRTIGSTVSDKELDKTDFEEIK